MHLDREHRHADRSTCLHSPDVAGLKDFAPGICPQELFYGLSLNMMREFLTAELDSN